MNATPTVILLVGLALAIAALLARSIWRRRPDHGRAVRLWPDEEPGAERRRALRHCPECGELVHVTAVACRFCGHALALPETKTDFCGFHPELFEHKARALEHLEQHGFLWLSHFTTIDLLHQEYGIEVCGIKAQTDARRMIHVLRPLFPDWRYTRLTFQDRDRDPGWKVEIFRRRREDADGENA